MINISCWKLKCDTDKNRAISKVILFDDIDGVLLWNFDDVFSAFDGEVFIFSQHHFAGYLCKKDVSRWQYCKNNNELNLHGIK